MDGVTISTKIKRHTILHYVDPNFYSFLCIIEKKIMLSSTFSTSLTTIMWICCIQRRNVEVFFLLFLENFRSQLVPSFCLTLLTFKTTFLSYSFFLFFISILSFWCVCVWHDVTIWHNFDIIVYRQNGWGGGPVLEKGNAPNIKRNKRVNICNVFFFLLLFLYWLCWRQIEIFNYTYLLLKNTNISNNGHLVHTFFWCS